MENITQKLADFVANIRFEDLPQHVVHESKRLLLDSIGCALAGLSTTKGKLAVEMAKKLGGPPDSTILADGNKVSSPGAAYANDNLINAMDYCEVPHVSPWIIPAPLALAECYSSHGKEFLLAVAIGHEIALRMEKALAQHFLNLVTEGPDMGKLIPKPVFGSSQHIFGGAAAAGKILKLNSEQIVHLLGLAGQYVPGAGGFKVEGGPYPQLQILCRWMAVPCGSLCGPACRNGLYRRHRSPGWRLFILEVLWCRPMATGFSVGRTWSRMESQYYLQDVSMLLGHEHCC